MQETRSYLFLILNILKTSLRLNPFMHSGQTRYNNEKERHDSLLDVLNFADG
jgi:hypothetical protein